MKKLKGYEIDTAIHNCEYDDLCETVAMNYSFGHELLAMAVLLGIITGIGWIIKAISWLL